MSGSGSSPGSGSGSVSNPGATTPPPTQPSPPAFVTTAIAGTSIEPAFMGVANPIFYYMWLPSPTQRPNRILVIDYEAWTRTSYSVSRDLERVIRELSNRSFRVVAVSPSSLRNIVSLSTGTLSIAVDLDIYTTPPGAVTGHSADYFVPLPQTQTNYQELTALGITVAPPLPVTSATTVTAMCGGSSGDPFFGGQSWDWNPFAPSPPAAVPPHLLPPVAPPAAPGPPAMHPQISFVRAPASGGGPGFGGASALVVNKRSFMQRRGLQLLIGGAVALTVGVVTWAINRFMSNKFVDDALLTSSFVGDLPKPVIEKLFAMELLNAVETGQDYTKVESGLKDVEIDVSGSKIEVEVRLLEIIEEPFTEDGKKAGEEWREQNTVVVSMTGAVAQMFAAPPQSEAEATARSFGVVGCGAGIASTALAWYLGGWKWSLGTLVASGLLLSLLF